MFRIVLAAYMLMLSLTGPTPCCCKLARVAMTIASLGKVSNPANVQAFNCCHRQLAGAVTGRGSGTGSDDGHTGPKPTGRCKCVKHLCGGVPAHKLEVVIDQSRSPVDDLWLNLAAPILPAADEMYTPVAYSAGTPPEPLSGRELRVALCSWRC